MGITRLGSLGLGSTDAPAALRRGVEQLRDEGVDVELVTGKAPAGGVATAILELARDAGADLLVVGNRGHGPLAGPLVGSVALRLIQTAPVPVTTVPCGPAPRTVAAAVTITSEAQLADVVFADDRVASDLDLFDRRAGTGWRPVTAGQFATDVRSLAAGFIAAGVQPRQRVAVLAATSYEWTSVDYALWTAGAVPVPIYETSSAEQVRWMLQDAAPVGVVVDHETHRRLVEKAAEGLPEPPRIGQIDSGGLDQQRAGGLGVDDARVHARRQQVSADDLATIIYTSGTTGQPRDA